MADNGVAAYWIFYRMHSELLKKRCISFKEPFEKRRFINDLWEEHKQTIAKAEKEAEEAKEKAKRAEKKAEKAEQERAKAAEEAKEAERDYRKDLDDIKVFVGAKTAKFAKK